MWIIELLIVLVFIWLGARLGSIGIGFAGGFGVLVLGLFGVKPGAIPVDVILIIMGVIAAIAAMQVAGGLDYLVHIATKILKRNPKQITFLAPVVTYTMTMFAGTGHLLDTAGNCRSSQAERDQAVAATLHRHRRFTDCHHRLADLGGRGLLLQRT